MPKEFLNKVSEQRNIPIKKVEHYWEKAKEIAKKKFKDVESSDYWRYVTGITKRMTGYVSESANDIPPKRVQFAIRRQLQTVLKPLFYKIVAGEPLPRGRACHANSFLYLMEHENPKLRQVMLYHLNTTNPEASILAHSVICEGNKIVYDSRQSKVTHLVDGTYYDTAANVVLYVGVSLTLDQIQMLISYED